MKFELDSKYKPAGDQPQAIEALIHGLEHREKFQTLLDVTGSGKTFTMANVIQYKKSTKQENLALNGVIPAYPFLA